jgi:4-hydroxy-tetrahydrodipicolinate synthase
MKSPLFTGVCTALVTPFIESKVNYPMMEQLLKRQIEAGVEAVVICGTTGEAPTLTDNEKIELFYRCKTYAGNRCKIIAGTGSNSTAHAVRLSIEAEKAGVDGLLVVSPYYNKATEDGLVAHYLAVAHAVSIPVILYNVPGRTGQDMPVNAYRRLSHIPNINGVKEASTDICKLINIRNACGNDFYIWTGNDNQTVPAISLGAKGVISVTSNVCPEEILLMTEAALDGDFDTASQIACQLQSLNDLLFCQVNPIPVKYAMKLIGYDCGRCRLPLTTLSKEDKEKLEKYFKV